MKFEKEIRLYCQGWHCDIVGDFPVPLKDFIAEMLSQEKYSFRVCFVGVNNSVPGVKSPCIEYIRPGQDYDKEWQLESQNPENLLDQIAYRNVIKCRTWGDWGDMQYYFTLADT